MERQIEQLEQRLEGLESSRTERLSPEKPEAAITPRRPVRKPLPAHLPRETKVYTPSHEACPSCGATLRSLGEDVSER